MRPRTARVGDPGAKSAASGKSSCSSPPEPWSRTRGILAGSVPGIEWWVCDVEVIGEQQHPCETKLPYSYKVISSLTTSVRRSSLAHSKHPVSFEPPNRQGSQEP